jgi:hypothetical protein
MKVEKGRVRASENQKLLPQRTRRNTEEGQKPTGPERSANTVYRTGQGAADATRIKNTTAIIQRCKI